MRNNAPQSTFLGTAKRIVRSVIRPKVNLVFNDCATRHHKRDVHNNGNILQRVARNGHNIGELALVNCTGGLNQLGSPTLAWWNSRTATGGSR